MEEMSLSTTFANVIAMVMKKLFVPVSCIGSILFLLSFGYHYISTRVSDICQSSRSLTVVAHEDDSILFMNPDIVRAIEAKECTVTVFLTAGDAGNLDAYWRRREDGAKAAYAYMADVSNIWKERDLITENHIIKEFHLRDDMHITLIFLRLPDGNFDGLGFSSTHYESLQKLLASTILVVHSVDGARTYSKQELVGVLHSLMSVYKPDTVRIMDYSRVATKDHSDHTAAGYVAKMASDAYARPHTVLLYRGYTISEFSENLSEAEATRKTAIFLSYASDDGGVCQTASACRIDRIYGPWLTRQYVVSNVAMK